MVAVIFAVVLAVASLANAQKIFMGACPNQAVVNPFDLPAYLGTWYEQAKYLTIFQIAGKCTTAVYTDAGNGVVGVNNTQRLILLNTPMSIIGTATLTDSASTEAKLTVRFPSAGNMPGAYNVLDTDYTTYAVVWSCRNGLFNLSNTQYMWVLTRARIPTTAQVANIKSKIQARGLNIGYLQTTPQNC